LQLILVKPVKRWVYLVSRVAGVVCVVWIAAVVAGLCELTGRLAWGEVVAPGVVGAAIVNCFADAILTASLLVLLGSLTRAYFNVAIYLGVELAFNAIQPILAMIRQSDTAFGHVLASHPVIELTLAQIDASLFPDFPPGLDGRWLALVLGEAAVALILAAIAFQRREVPYGAD
jgi:hypothetical protein